jgi:hypothetical protein
MREGNGFSTAVYDILSNPAVSNASRRVTATGFQEIRFWLADRIFEGCGSSALWSGVPHGRGKLVFRLGPPTSWFQSKHALDFADPSGPWLTNHLKHMWPCILAEIENRFFVVSVVVGQVFLKHVLEPLTE